MILYRHAAISAELGAVLRHVGVCALVTLFVKSGLNGVLFCRFGGGISGQLTF